MGRPHRHGAKFDLRDLETWPEPSADHRCETDDYGEVRVRAWSDLHPKTRRIGERYGCERAPVVKGTVILVEVSRLPRETRKPKQLWMWWTGEGEPDLGLLWKSCCRRSSLEHAIKFLKLTLGWTSPRVSGVHSAQTRQRHRCRLGVALGEAALTEATDPDEGVEGILRPSDVFRYTGKGTETRGRSPGRPKGGLLGPARRYSAIKKAAQLPSDGEYNLLQSGPSGLRVPVRN